MRRDDGEGERLRALVEGADWAPLGTSDAIDANATTPEVDLDIEKPRQGGAFGEADEGTRTLDLLHGKQTL
jgi:hypothetical protein